MKNSLNFTVLIATVIITCLSTNSHAKVYLCGASGEIVYSEAPCDIPKTDGSLQPIKSDIVDKDIVDDTVMMIRKAYFNRDILAIERLLSDDFVFVSNDADWDGREIFNTDKMGFFGLITEQLLAMTRYEQDIDKYSVNLIDGHWIAETTSSERVWLGEKLIEARLLERVKVIAVDGVAKVQSIKQIELK